MNTRSIMHCCQAAARGDDRTTLASRCLRGTTLSLFTTRTTVVKGSMYNFNVKEPEVGASDILA